MVEELVHGVHRLGGRGLTWARGHPGRQIGQAAGACGGHEAQTELQEQEGGCEQGNGREHASPAASVGLDGVGDGPFSRVGVVHGELDRTV